MREDTKIELAFTAAAMENNYGNYHEPDQYTEEDMEAYVHEFFRGQEMDTDKLQVPLMCLIESVDPESDEFLEWVENKALWEDMMDEVNFRPRKRNGFYELAKTAKGMTMLKIDPRVPIYLGKTLGKRTGNMVPKLGFYSGVQEFPAITAGEAEDSAFRTLTPDHAAKVEKAVAELSGSVILFGAHTGYALYFMDQNPQIEKVLVVDHKSRATDVIFEEIVPKLSLNVDFLDADPYSALSLLSDGLYDHAMIQTKTALSVDFKQIIREFLSTRHFHKTKVHELYPEKVEFALMLSLISQGEEP